MAGDDHEGKQAAAEIAAASPKPAEAGISAEPTGFGTLAKPVEAGTSSAEMTPSPTLSEWTASDARGGLNEVGEIPETEASTREPAPREYASGTAATAPVSSPAVAPKRRSLWPVAGGVVVGAALGAGSAYLVYANFPAANDLDQRVTALASQVDSLSRRPDPQDQLAALKSSIANVSGKVAALETAAQAKPNVAAGAAPGQPQQASPSDVPQKLAALQASVAAMQQRSASVNDLAAAQSKLAAVSASLADVQKQASASRTDVQALQSGQQALQNGQKTIEDKVGSPALAVVADSLVQQVSRGLPFTTQVNALDAIGVDPAKIAILRQFAEAGVPTASVLAAKFEPLTEGLLATGSKVPTNASFWDRLKGGASGLVSVQRVDAVSGDDVASRVARIKADLGRNDVIDAVKTWGLLPADAKAKPDVAAWGALAKTHAEAITAADAIGHDAIAALAVKKS